MRILKMFIIAASMLAMVGSLDAQVKGNPACTTYQNSGQTVPNGLWRVCIVGDELTIDKNTALPANFGSTLRTLKIHADGQVELSSLLLSTMTGNGVRCLQASNAGVLGSGSSACAIAYSNDYAFSPQTPGGSLTAAQSSTVTMTPCPSGLGGSDSGHYLYISEGTGTAETVLVTGGNCVSGGTTGTVQFTPANNHSGAFTVRSGSDGIAEAFYANAGSTRVAVHVPAGQHSVKGPITITASMWPDISGEGISSELSTDFAAGDTLDIKPNGLGFFSVKHLLFRPGTALKTSGAEIHTQNSGNISDLIITSPWIGIRLENVNQPIMDKIQILSAAKLGIFVDRNVAGASGLNLTGAQVSMDSGSLASDTAGLYVQATATGAAITTVSVANSTFQNGKYNIKFVNSALSVMGETQFTNTVIDSATVESVFVENLGAAGTSFAFTFNGVRGGSTQPNVPIFDFDNIWDVNLNNLDINNSASAAGVILRGCLNCKVTNSNIGASGVQIDITVSGSNVSKNVTVANCHLGYLEGNSPAGTEGVLVSDAAHDILSITGNVFSTALSPAIDLGASVGSAVLLASNLGVLNRNTTASSASTLAFPTLDNGQLLSVSGTTAVTAVSGLRSGQFGTIVFTNATPGAWTAGATIGNSGTPTQNVPVPFTFDGTKIWMKF